ncbi:MAG: hypothetical protein AAB538_06375, partial [Patescibacteria group bacterium]
LAAEELGYLNVSLTFGARLTIIAMALSEVNLAWMSSLYVTAREEFQKTVAKNMERVFLVMWGLSATLMFFTPEIVRYIIGQEFIPAEPLIYIMTFAFFLYSLLDIGTSSVFVPADQPRLRSIVFGIKVLISAAVIGWFLTTQPSPLLSAWGVLAGVVVAYGAMVGLVKSRFHVQLLPRSLWVLLFALAVSLVWLFQEPQLILRIGAFLLLATYAGWQAKQRGLIPGQISPGINIIGFGTAFDAPSWTNRQHVLSRVAKTYPVLYVEPREWIVRSISRHWRNPVRLLSFLWRLIGYQKRGKQLYLISQWNLIPGSREYKAVAAFDHFLNRWRVKVLAVLLGFHSPKTVLWLYETEAA